MSNISGLSDLNKRNDEKNEGNELYTGGNDTRGGGTYYSFGVYFFVLSLISFSLLVLFRIWSERVGSIGQVQILHCRCVSLFRSHIKILIRLQVEGKCIIPTKKCGGGSKADNLQKRNCDR